MTRDEIILTGLAEECCEVGQRISKALRFGLAEVQPGQGLNNADRIIEELHDLISMAMIAEDEGILPTIMPSQSRINTKRAKMEKYLSYSRKCGTLVE